MKGRIISLLSFSLLMASGIAHAERSYYGSELCGYPEFQCIQIKGGDSWEKLFPDPRQREIVKRLNRTNIALRYRSWIVVPNDLNGISFMDMSPFPAHLSTEGKKLVVVDLNKQAFGAYDEQGELVHWGPVSGGKGYCPDIGKACTTKTGEFVMFEKKGPRCRSSQFPVETGGGAPMPYCMHFFRGIALHASTLPGFNASHGCVRLFKNDAKWLNRDFMDTGTRVVVRGS